MSSTKAAIYARYSSSQQRETSIEDQIASCKAMAAREGWSIANRHIYADKAQSGAKHNRASLAELRAAAEAGEFKIIIVDDLSRIARDSLFLAMFMADMESAQVRVIGVADRVDTAEEQSDLTVQFRGIVNELYLKDLRAKTIRGIMGQKQRGFFLGEKTYGYESKPVWSTTPERDDRPEGYDMRILETQARVVRRIFTMAAEGISINRIVKTLNREGVKGMYRTKAWSPGSVSRILNNEKYKGRWVWNKTRQIRNRKTGEKRTVPRPESEWVVFEREELRIVSDDLWERAHARRRKARKAYGDGPFGHEQKGASVAHPSTLLAGTLKCADCGSNLVQVAGKYGGYFGCSGRLRSACDNKVTVRRTLAEEAIVNFVRGLLRDAEGIERLLKRVATTVKELAEIRPADVESKERELKEARRNMAHFVEFVAQGKAVAALREAMEATEKKITALEEEATALRRLMSRQFEPPPRAWIEERLHNLHELLERDTLNSALALREVLGEVEMVPVVPDIGRPYYQARAKVCVLDLLKTPTACGHEEGPDRTEGAGQGHEFRFFTGSGAEGDRTPDLCIANAPLSQLSYGPVLDDGR